MKHLSPSIVEFTSDAEVLAHERYNGFLDEGMGIPEAANLALIRMKVVEFPSDEFIKYLSDDTCARWGRGIMIKRQWR